MLNAYIQPTAKYNIRDLTIAEGPRDALYQLNLVNITVQMYEQFHS